MSALPGKQQQPHSTAASEAKTSAIAPSPSNAAAQGSERVSAGAAASSVASHVGVAAPPAASAASSTNVSTPASTPASAAAAAAAAVERRVFGRRLPPSPRNAAGSSGASSGGNDNGTPEGDDGVIDADGQLFASQPIFFCLFRLNYLCVSDRVARHGRWRPRPHAHRVDHRGQPPKVRTICCFVRKLSLLASIAAQPQCSSQPGSLPCHLKQPPAYWRIPMRLRPPLIPHHSRRRPPPPAISKTGFGSTGCRLAGCFFLHIFQLLERCPHVSLFSCQQTSACIAGAGRKRGCFGIAAAAATTTAATTTTTAAAADSPRSLPYDFVRRPAYSVQPKEKQPAVHRLASRQRGQR
jgi:hypothetical protein